MEKDIDQQDYQDLRQHYLDEETALLLRARERRQAEGTTRPIARWYGRRGGSSRRTYVCYLCDCVIDTESASWRQTKHAVDAIEEHRREHLEEPEQLLAERKAGLD